MYKLQFNLRKKEKKKYVWSSILSLATLTVRWSVNSWVWGCVGGGAPGWGEEHVGVVESILLPPPPSTPIH